MIPSGIFLENINCKKDLTLLTYVPKWSGVSEHFGTLCIAEL